MAWEGEGPRGHPAELVSARGSAGASPSQLRVPLTAQDSIVFHNETINARLGPLRTGVVPRFAIVLSQFRDLFPQFRYFPPHSRHRRSNEDETHGKEAEEDHSPASRIGTIDHRKPKVLADRDE